MEQKTCTKCDKPFPATSEFFSPNKTGKYSLASRCKKCCNEQNRKYYKNNSESCKQRNSEYRKNNREYRNQQTREWRKNNLEKDRKRNREWQKDNDYYKNNREKIIEQSREYRKNNPEKVAACKAKYAARRRARKLNQSPILTDSEDKQIKLIYKESQKLGPDWQVDHKIPISKDGQHHPKNLQIVTAIYNQQKGAKLNFRLPTEKEIFNGKPYRYM